MTFEHQILLNQYGQGLLDLESFSNAVGLEDSGQRKLFFEALLFLIQQSKPTGADIAPAIEASGLKPGFTPCVLLQKGVAPHQLKKMVELPEAESGKTLLLLLHLFKIAYQRRFAAEKNDPDKWWYWDLSDDKNLEKLRLEY